ncbi:MAG: peptidylprolyl isomerase [Bacteroidota bacterium]|nr:peptidylprolyl isomerase [Odoribacter sp.]MDP3643708.1 peptidylprolyl isomerase [Bacteroidota bacterium]
MKIILFYAILNFFFLSLSAQKTPSCLIKTTLGDIQIELYPEQSPLTVSNFLNYVDHQLYDGTSFYRVCTPENEKDRKVKIEVIQGGDIPEGKQFAPIRIETTIQTGLKHQNGTLAMARDKPNSATSSFFICIGNQPELDFAGKRNPDGQGFAAFGKVTKGMRVVKKIQAQENKDQYLISPVKIHSIQRLNQ